MNFIQCTCQHSFQDTLYGKQQRLAQTMKVKAKGLQQQYRCSVCGKVTSQLTPDIRTQAQKDLLQQYLNNR